MQSVTPLQVPSSIISMPSIKGKDVMSMKYDYDRVGSNSSVIVEPAIVRFSGFEVGKMNVLKVRIINKSNTNQRTAILQPKTEFFNIRVDKKGAIPPGVSEDVYVQFKPTEYKYYYDAIRVSTQGDTILIPIHGYPALSRDNLRDVFPRLIDFGTVDVGDIQVNRYPIQCKIPLNFEFEFTIIKDNQDIKINPYKGVVPGKGIIEIEISYAPTTNITCVLEAELKIGQFDFEPLSIKVMGSGRSFDVKGTAKKRPLSNNKLKAIVLQQPQVQKTIVSQQSQDNLDENSLPEQSPKVIYETDKNIAIDEYKPLIKSSNQKNIAHRMEKVEIVEFKGTNLIGRQALEKVFLDRFNAVMQLDKDKEIRLKQYIGDPPIRADTIQQIMQERDQYRGQKLSDIERKSVSRYQLELDQDSAVIDSILPKYECQWDFDKNDTIMLKKLKLKKFVFAVTRVIYRIRFSNRLQKIRAFLKGAKTREEVRKLVNQDWQKAEYAGVGKKDFVSFTFEFEENRIGKFCLPVQYQDSNTFSQFKFDINPRTGFDDWSPIEQIPYCDQEVMQYKNWDYPQLTIHPPRMETLIFRDGAEEEKAIRGKICLMELKFQEDIIDALKALFQKPPEHESYQLIQKHKTLKYYQQAIEMNPVEPYYHLGFSKALNIGSDLDPDIALSHDILKQEFMNRAPGFNNLNLMYEMNLEQWFYQERNMQLAYDYGLEDTHERYCPEILPDVEPDDHFTDDDSDGEGPPKIEAQDVNDFLKKLEQDQVQRSEVIDLQEELLTKINANLTAEKTKWISTIPSRTSDYNKYISNVNNKMVIL